MAVCPRCDLPTFLTDGEQFPGVPYRSGIEHLPSDVDTLFEEARDAMGVSAYTAAMMAGRKLLAHVAVEKGAPAGATFQAYVDYLVEHSIIAADMKDWVDEIRQLGNEANHEIRLGAKEDADYVLDFVVMLLRIVYQFPEQARRSTQARAARKQPS